jgi:vitamin-K-epoxide reductase (warfarin-sensitive)
MVMIIIILALIGFCISLYTYTVEKKIKDEPDYKPVCDLSDRISCTKPMKSPYANLFFASNAVAGMGYYLLVALLAFFNLNLLLVIATIGGCLVSAVMAYLLYFKIQSLCILCTSLYVVNILLLLCALKFA